MSDNLVLEHLRAIRADMQDVLAEQRAQCRLMAGIEHRLVRLIGGVGHLEGGLAEFRAQTCSRLDRVSDRLDRIEHRLEIVSA